MKKDRNVYKLHSIYDTETTNIGNGVNTRAFPILFIFNDIKNCTIKDYEPGISSEYVHFLREVRQAITYIEEAILWGKAQNFIPIIAAYNLMFDLKPLMHELSRRYAIFACAASSTNAYYVDIQKDSKTLLRFWDTFHLERNGLAAMGRTCGIKKASGDWDYTLVRTPKTPLTDDELFYAKRDVQVIPAYLRYLLEANEYIKEEDFGVSVLTKTSLVRKLAKEQIGKLYYKNAKNKRVSLAYASNATCMQELPSDFETYGLRKACFRGGFTFTSANYASTLLKNVTSLDVTSMHHTFINGFLVPVHFKKTDTEILHIAAKNILNTPIKKILKHFQNPFSVAVHVKIQFRNIRLKENTIFERAGIACLPQSKFSKKAAILDIGKNERDEIQEEELKKEGFVDEAENPVFAFSKLISADIATVHVNEIELWNIGQVYDFDGFTVLDGESTTKFIIPPDYVTLQSNLLFQRKNEMKKIVNTYTEGQPYTEKVGDTIPEALAKDIKAGSASLAFLNSYYSSTVKGSFNSIFGANAQDIYKPDFMVDDAGDLCVDVETKTTRDNWEDMQPKKCSVLYTYGMRIVGGSRMHLIIAMQLLDKVFGKLIKICGGDTDSIKMSCQKNVHDEDILDALKPLHDACDNALNFCQKRVRKNYPELASNLKNIGHFDIEISEENRYLYHVELWNKARFSIDKEGEPHVTMAGLSRPPGTYTILDFIKGMLKHYDFKDIWQKVLSYNTIVSHDICHALEHHIPKANEKYQGYVTDYLGKKSYVDTYQTIALYNADRFLGDVEKNANYTNILYLDKIKHKADTAMKTLEIYKGQPRISYSNEEGLMVCL